MHSSNLKPRFVIGLILAIVTILILLKLTINPEISWLIVFAPIWFPALVLAFNLVFGINND